MVDVAYTKFRPGGWRNKPNLSTPLTAEALDHFEDGIAASEVATYVGLARTPELLIVGSITRDANGAATSAAVQWPDGTPGTYTALVVSTSFPGAVDSYEITYGNPVVNTFTQPTVTRDPVSGAVTACPAIVVS